MQACPDSAASATLAVCRTLTSSTFAPTPPTRSAKAPSARTRSRCWQRREQMPAAAITDTGNLFGALEFSQYCVAKGIQPIIGCQMALARADNPRLAPDPIVLLAQDAAGTGQSAAPVVDGVPRHRPKPEAAAVVRAHCRERRRPAAADRRHHRADRPPAGRGPEAGGRTAAGRDGTRRSRGARSRSCIATACRWKPPSNPA